MSGRRLIVEADGGSRGNPGTAGYGAVVRDALTGELLAERYEYLGIVTNNVAEYRGLLAALQAAREIDAEAYIEARLDSRLVVEQMSGRWQVKHPDLRLLVRECATVAASFGTGHVAYTWIPRERNKDADRLANRAMDEGSGIAPRSSLPGEPRAGSSLRVGSSSPGAAASSAASPRVGLTPLAPVVPNRIAGWSAGPAPTTLLLVRHGVTAFSLERRFSGSSDPPLVEQGRQEARAVAAALGARGGIQRVVSSPLSRCRDTAAAIGSALGLGVDIDDDLREVDFGMWEGLTFGVVEERWPRELSMWLGDTAISPPGGESYEALHHRARTVQERIVNRHRGETICVVSHSRPIAMFAINLLAAPVNSLFRMHVDNASITELEYYDDGPMLVRSFNNVSHLV